ncbi:MAG: nucleotide exchange factor GrpE [Cytophagaceae bacterium]|nr:nucleotide exchange factor GrpE [Cytophagaceae bacterium]MDW8455791.1 nucleotide exchange factor GrpE [Cytophagaceae bacterium]
MLSEEKNESQEQTTVSNETSSESKESSALPNLEAELEALKSENEALKDKYLRLYSEFENFRKRNIKEKAELIKSASEDTILAILPVIDDLERALKSFGENELLKEQLEGITLIYNKLVKSLEAKGLKAMTCIGEVFNPELHEAITQTPIEDESMKGKIIDEVQKGYFLHDKVIRFAKVIIGA